MKRYFPFLMVILLLLSPFLSIFLTPITMIPAAVLALGPFLPKECKHIQGESLCGFGMMIVIGLLLNLFLAYILCGYVWIKFPQHKLNPWVKLGLLLVYYVAFIAVVVWAQKTGLMK